MSGLRSSLPGLSATVPKQAKCISRQCPAQVINQRQSRHIACRTSMVDVQQALNSGSNPLELLRVTRDPQQRARLMTALDTQMRHYSDVYQPSTVEQFLAKELGIWSYNVMLFAVANPALQALDVDSQVKPAIKSLKAANVDPQEIWFLVTKHLEIFKHPISLQRWLDFLSAQALPARDMATFLLRAPDVLLTDGTQAQALQVLGYLKSLGIKQEYIFSRVLCSCPGILLQDVEFQLQPIVSFLMALGLETQHIARMACVYPELLLASVPDQLQPLVAYLQDIGCSSLQCARLLQEVPQALSKAPADVFDARILALQLLGVRDDQMRSIVSRSTAWLTTKGAPQEQIEYLTEQLRFSAGQVGYLVTQCPAILSEKPLELQRKIEFLHKELNMELNDLAKHPTYLGASLMQVIGPRHAFAVSKGLEAKLLTSGAACSSKEVRAHGGGFGWDLTALVAGEDVDFADSLGASVNEYEGFRTSFEEEYTAKLSKDAAKEFQDELKKLGIYEGQ